MIIIIIIIIIIITMAGLEGAEGLSLLLSRLLLYVCRLVYVAIDVMCDTVPSVFKGFQVFACLAVSAGGPRGLSLIHISEPTRLLSISYAVFCLKKKNERGETSAVDVKQRRC